jgi:hypothetical protein
LDLSRRTRGLSAYVARVIVTSQLEGFPDSRNSARSDRRPGRMEFVYSAHLEIEQVVSRVGIQRCADDMRSSRARMRSAEKMIGA